MTTRNPRFRLSDELAQMMFNSVVARSRINDSRDASTIRQILDAAAFGDEQSMFKAMSLLELFSVDNASDLDLNERAVDFGAGDPGSSLSERQGATRAQGTLEFRRISTTGTIQIAAGSKAAKPGNPQIVAATTTAGTIPDGATSSGPIAAVTEQTGATANGAAGTFIKLISRVPGVNSVTNPTPFRYGESRESDDDFRARIKNHWRTLALCPKKAIEVLAREVELADGRRVVSATAVERDDEPGRATLYIDDGTGAIAAGQVQLVTSETVLESATGGEQRLQLYRYPVVESAGFTISVDGVAQLRDSDYYLMPGTGAFVLSETSYPDGLTAGQQVTASYSYYTGLIAETQWKIDGRQDNRTEYPGWRALGALVVVKPPTTQYIQVEARPITLAGYDRTVVAERARDEVSRYINGLAIGEDVVRHEIIERVMGVPGMLDLVLTLPVGNVPIPDDTVARVRDSDMTIE